MDILVNDNDCCFFSVGNMSSDPDFDIFMYQSCIAVIIMGIIGNEITGKWRATPFMCKFAFNELKVSYDYNNHG